MRRPKKYGAGEATQYITRRAALRKLQLSLKDFRRLCIIKGVYPREPKHRRRAQKGSSDLKILYHAKDIRFLLHEPIIWTLRDYKIFAKKTNRDRAIRDFQNLNRRLAQFPELKIDHIVKERYPTFIDAIKDLDDCLTLVFLFSTFPSLRLIPREQSFLCRRLTIEFLHYLITSKSLCNVFISIKGYYFQADIKGQKVTWILPHYYPFKPHSKEEVDFKVMSIFVEFYTIMLGFVNFRLYHDINLVYPPQLPSSVLNNNLDGTSDLTEHTYVADRIAALNSDLVRRANEVTETEDLHLIDVELLDQGDNCKRMLKIREEAQEMSRLRTLFKGLKIFLNREVPREPLVVLIRSFGGMVSWDGSIFPGATFNEDDEDIHYHIVDRPSLSKQYMSRDYVQPQWVFDCVNRRELLPTSKYFIGVELPPHLSPFVDRNRNAYIPPEEKALHDPSLVEDNDEEAETDEEENAEQIQNLRENQLQRVYQEEKAECDDYGSKSKFANVDDVEDNEDYYEEEESALNITDKEQIREKERKNMSVKTGQDHKENKRLLRKNKVDEHRLQARMVKPRHRNLFRKLIREKQAKEKEEWLLKKKRRTIDAEKKNKRKTKSMKS